MKAEQMTTDPKRARELQLIREQLEQVNRNLSRIAVELGSRQVE